MIRLRFIAQYDLESTIDVPSGLCKLPSDVDPDSLTRMVGKRFREMYYVVMAV